MYFLCNFMVGPQHTHITPLYRTVVPLDYPSSLSCTVEPRPTNTPEKWLSMILQILYLVPTAFTLYYVCVQSNPLKCGNPLPPPPTLEGFMCTTMLLQYVVSRTPVLYDPKVACCDVLSNTLFPHFSLSFSFTGCSLDDLQHHCWKPSPYWVCSERWPDTCRYWHHDQGERHMAAALNGCRTALVGIGWTISHLVSTNRLRNNSPPLVGAPFLDL